MLDLIQPMSYGAGPRLPHEHPSVCSKTHQNQMLFKTSETSAMSRRTSDPAVAQKEDSHYLHCVQQTAPTYVDHTECYTAKKTNTSSSEDRREATSRIAISGAKKPSPRHMKQVPRNSTAR
eukprot:GILJ01005773.1.p1 GENE.GILJ01005773.1~~GILJ01005773.1.p1  ORF type:complete len:121 (+),score=6.57 GILJ01005773.1:945-1307(+)